MASSRQVITAILEAATGVTSLCSSRIYPGRVVQNPQRPYIVHWKISHPRTHAFGVDKTTGVARHQVRFVGTTTTQTEALAAAGKAALSRYQGTATGITVQDILLDDENDAFFDPETGEYGIDHDYLVWHEE